MSGERGLPEERAADPLAALAQRRRAVDAAWFVPDPASTAAALTDLPVLFRRLRDSGVTIAVATTDDREPTDATLRALGIREDVSALACGDDGVGVKPDPRMLLALCEVVRIAPQRTAIVGDTVADMTMGRDAGAGRVIGVLSGIDDRAHLEPLADLILPSIADLAPD